MRRGEALAVVAVLAVAVLAALVPVGSAERVYEQQGEGRVHDHHHASYDDPVDFGEDEEVEDVHRGIPVVEDDVPEWVKLTFADKFIALGEGEFISLGEDVDAKDVMEADYDRDRDHFGEDSESEKEQSNSEYEYFYSDEEGFEIDPSRDVLVSDPRKQAQHHHHHHHPHDKQDAEMEIVEENSEGEAYDDEEEEEGGEDEDVALANAVRAHRDEVDRSRAHKPVTVALNDGLPGEGWKDRMEKGVADAVSLLETETITRAPSHAPGSRRARLKSMQQQHQQRASASASASAKATKGRRGARSDAKAKAQQGNKTPSSSSTTETARPRPTTGMGVDALQADVATKPVRPTHVGKRYQGAGGGVRLNTKDPRLAAIAMLQEEEVAREKQGEHKLRLDKQGQETAINHKEWLALHTDKDEVKLPSLQRRMYANGVKVPDWEVGYVDDVLQQFGY